VDIRTFAVEETSILELVGADESPLVGEDGQRMTVTLYGPGSKPYAKAQAAQSNRMLDRLKKKGRADQGAEEKAREEAEFLAGCTKEFSANIEYESLKGEALFRAVYADASIGFIAEQVGKHIGEWGNFSKGSPKP
jgi:hypothetical protein